MEMNKWCYSAEVLQAGARRRRSESRRNIINIFFALRISFMMYIAQIYTEVGESGVAQKAGE